MMSDGLSLSFYNIQMRQLTLEGRGMNQEKQAKGKYIYKRLFD